MGYYGDKNDKAARSNKRIKRMLEEHKGKNGVIPVIFNYRFEDNRSPEFYLVVIPNPKSFISIRKTCGTPQAWRSGVLVDTQKSTKL